MGFSLSGHVVTSASKAVVTYRSGVTSPKPSLVSKWILSSSSHIEDHYSLLPFEIQMDSRSSLRKVPCPVLGQITPRSHHPPPKTREARTSECPPRGLCCSLISGVRSET